MNKKPLNFILPLIVYPFPIMISIGENDDSLKKALKKYIWDENIRKEVEADVLNIGSTVRGRVVMTTCNRSIVRIAEYPKSPEDFGNLAHEIFHTVVFILDRAGVSFFSGQPNEAYAYLIGYITTEIHKKIR